jgi:hypothetical protein
MTLRTRSTSPGATLAMLLLTATCTAAIMLPPLASTAVAQRSAGMEAELEEFYDELKQYGRWINHPRWGEVWAPDADDGTWKPYTRGHWVQTEEHGWYWESEEPWGWATYHYGRWLLDERRGWLWVPGRQWGPAWVAWRESDEYIGWAPLPPEAEWDDDRNDLNFSESYFDSPRYANAWSYVAPTYLTTPGLYRYLAPRSRASFIYRDTRFVRSYSSGDRRVFNRGIDVRIIERATRRPVDRVSIVVGGSPRDAGPRRGGDLRGPISVYRPDFNNPRRNDWRQPTRGGDGDRNRQFEGRGDGRRDSDWNRRSGPERGESRDNRPGRPEPRNEPRMRPQQETQPPPNLRPEQRPEARTEPRVRPQQEPSPQPNVRPEVRPEGRGDQRTQSRTEQPRSDQGSQKRGQEVRPETKPQGRPEGSPEGRPEGRPDGRGDQRRSDQRQ